MESSDQYYPMLRHSLLCMTCVAVVWNVMTNPGISGELLWLMLGLATSVGFARAERKRLPGFAHRLQVRRWNLGLRWAFAALLTTGYSVLYWMPEAVEPLLPMVDDLSSSMRGMEADRWWLYGVLYTFAVVASGMVVFQRYRHDAYQRRRTLVVTLAQLVFAFTLPAVLQGLDHDHASLHRDIKLFWPLDFSFFEPNRLEAAVEGGAIGRLYFALGVVLFLVVAPWATYHWGKRWYCSWICGCGSLAETVGDGFRTLSSSSETSWKWERWLIYPILIWVTLTTGVVVFAYAMDCQSLWGWSIYEVFTRPYAFAIGALFSGVIGVGFYPLLGNRVWCRFGCPLAAYMGIVQRFKSKFRVSTQAGGCIACGACTLHCEMGIDVRAYAMRGEDVRRASCVGCGVCAEVCPRDVIRLESGTDGLHWVLSE